MTMRVRTIVEVELAFVQDVWLNVLIKQNQQVIRPRTVVKCSWEDTFEMLPGKLKKCRLRSLWRRSSVQMKSLWMHT